MIEEPIEMRDALIELALRGRAVRRVYRAPGGESVPFTVGEGYASAALPPVRGWGVFVFEDGEG